MHYKTYWLAGLLGPLLVAHGAVQAIEARIAGSATHTVFIQDGNVHGMGQNRSGELTTAADLEHRTPVFTGFVNAKSVAATQDRTAVLGHDGKITFKGRRAIAQAVAAKGSYGLPVDVVASDFALGLEECFYVAGGILYKWNYLAASAPVALTSTAMGKVRSVAAGAFHAIVLFEDGTVGTYGTRNTYGQLGNGGLVPSATVTRIALSGITEVSAAPESSVAVGPMGTVRAFGRNNQGQFGLGDQEPRMVPTAIPVPAGMRKFRLGPSSGQALMSDGTLRAVGWHNFIAGGIYNFNASWVALPVSGVSNFEIVAGERTLVDTGASGVLSGWGGNLSGSLGDGTTTERHQLVQASYAPRPSSIVPPQPPVDPFCQSLQTTSPFGKISLKDFARCHIVLYDSMNACIKANPRVPGIGELCKNLIPPSQRGNGRRP